VGLVGEPMIFRARAMSSKQEHCRVTVLDDYQNVAPARADYPVLDARGYPSQSLTTISQAPTPSSSVCNHSTWSARCENARR
jgi:hypothetical protein